MIMGRSLLLGHRYLIRVLYRHGHEYPTFLAEVGKVAVKSNGDEALSNDFLKVTQMKNAE